MSGRVEAPKTSRVAAERRLAKAYADLVNNFGPDPAPLPESLPRFIGAVNDWLLTQFRYKGPRSILEPHDASGEPPIIILNPDRPR